MPLTPLKTVSVNSSNQLVTINDTTVYGAPNFDRGDHGNICLVFSSTSKGDIVREAISTATIKDRTVDLEYEIAINDAVKLKIVLVIVENWDETITYALGNVTHDGEKFYTSLQNGNLNNPTSNGTWWVEIDLTTSQGLRTLFDYSGDTPVPGSLITITSDSIAVYSNIAKYENNLIQSQAICSCFNGCVIENYEKIRLLYEGIVHGTDNDERQEMYEYLLELTKR